MKETGSLIHVPASVKGLIFDCDGTLVDSMPQHLQAWQFACRDLGEPYRQDFFTSLRGMEEREIISLHNARFGTDFDPGMVVELKHKYLRETLHQVAPIDPVVDVVFRFRGRLPMAVVSGGTLANVKAELAAIHILDYFTIFLTADDPFPAKPAPNLFIEAARRLGVPAVDCLVFEDGDLGIAGAVKAGMKTVDVRQIPGL